MFWRAFKLSTIILVLSAFPILVQAQEGGEDGDMESEAGSNMEGGMEGDKEGKAQEGSEQVAPAPAIYLPLKPAFVVNYGGKGRLRYLKTEMAVRLGSTDVANSVRHHMPYIRNNLVMLFARQTEETINSQEGREKLRQDALEEVRKILMEEDKAEGVIDIFFNTFIVQN